MEALIVGARALGVALTPEQIERYRLYLARLTAWNARLNLTSPAALADAERVHFLDSLTLAPLVGEARNLIDVGSGAGFPGLALKIVLPALRVVLVEATGKKAEFLRAVSRDLELEDVEIVADRAEVAAHASGLREAFDVATARALGPLPVVLELTLPFCRLGGVALAPRGADAEDEATRIAAALDALGGVLRRVQPVDVPGLPPGRSIVVVDKAAPTPARYPRRAGMPAKRPLGQA